MEVADVEEKGMQVLYQDEAGVHVMDRCGEGEGLRAGAAESVGAAVWCGRP